MRALTRINAAAAAGNQGIGTATEMLQQSLEEEALKIPAVQTIAERYKGRIDNPDFLRELHAVPEYAALRDVYQNMLNRIGGASPGQPAATTPMFPPAGQTAAAPVTPATTPQSQPHQGAASVGVGPGSNLARWMGVGRPTSASAIAAPLPDGFPSGSEWLPDGRIRLPDGTIVRKSQ
jgi:hypothetical protein